MWLLYNIEILRALRFKSSYAFLKRPPGVTLLAQLGWINPYIIKLYRHWNVGMDD